MSDERYATIPFLSRLRIFSSIASGRVAPVAFQRAARPIPLSSLGIEKECPTPMVRNGLVEWPLPLTVRPPNRRSGPFPPIDIIPKRYEYKAEDTFRNVEDLDAASGRRRATPRWDSSHDQFHRGRCKTRRRTNQGRHTMRTLAKAAVAAAAVGAAVVVTTPMLLRVRGRRATSQERETCSGRINWT